MALPDGSDVDKLAEVGLAFLYLTMHEGSGGTRAWKSLDWDVLDLLYERGWISNPKSKAKSVALTEEAAELAGSYFEKHFGPGT